MKIISKTVDVLTEVKGKYNGYDYHVLVSSRNGNIHTVSHLDQKLANWFTAEEKNDLKEELRNKIK